MLDPKYCPIYDKGKWQTIFLEPSNSENHTIIDIPGAEITNNTIILPHNFVLVDIKYDCQLNDGYRIINNIYSNNGVYQIIPFNNINGNDINSFREATTDAYIYIFGYFK